MNRFLKIFRKGMSCHEVMEILQAYLDNEISADEARQVSKHLDDCKACDRESQVYKDIKASLAARQRPVDPEIMDALHDFCGDLMTEGAD